VGVSAKYDATKLEDLIRHPTAKMTAGGMPTADLKEDEMKQLIAYLQSLK
jgi:cytochrome c1